MEAEKAFFVFMLIASLIGMVFLFRWCWKHRMFVDTSNDKFYFNKQMAWQSAFLMLPVMALEPGSMGLDDAVAGAIVLGFVFVLGGFLGHAIHRPR